MQKADVKKNFGASVKGWRKRLGLSQEELAERADLHRTYVSDVERGARNLSLESITRMAYALNIPVAELFPSETNGQNKQNALGKDLVDILLVEDNADDVELTLHAFKQSRIANRITVAPDGQDALDYLFGEGNYAASPPADRPQIVLLDLYLPKVTGIDVLRRIKADPRTRAIPVVILTVSQAFSDFAECQRLGAETYIVKPLNFHRLSQITPRLNLDWALFRPAAAKPVPLHA